MKPKEKAQELTDKFYYKFGTLNQERNNKYLIFGKELKMKLQNCKELK